MTTSWEQLTDQIDDLQREIQQRGSVAWYRGQRLNTPWPLRSRLHRYLLDLSAASDLPTTGAAGRDWFREEYKTLYRRFKSDAWPLLDADERTDWGTVFTMQHYGLPTRLLDWTESVACALFFAQWNRMPDDEAVIYVLDPMVLNRIAVNQDGLIQLDEAADHALFEHQHWHPKWKPPEEDLPTVAVVPIFTNPRMSTQRSMFTLCGDSFLPLDEQFPGRLLSGEALTRIPLAPDISTDCQRFLDLSGINAFSIFPDLEGIRMKHEAAMRKTIADVKELRKTHGASST